MTPFLDQHLIFPILLFLQEVGIYKQEDVTRAELALLGETSMIDFAVDKYQAIGEEAPESLTARRELVIESLGNVRDQVLPLLEVLEDDDKVKRMQTFKSTAEMCHEFEHDPSIIEALAK